MMLLTTHELGLQCVLYFAGLQIFFSSFEGKLEEHTAGVCQAHPTHLLQSAVHGQESQFSSAACSTQLQLPSGLALAAFCSCTFTSCTAIIFAGQCLCTLQCSLAIVYLVFSYHQLKVKYYQVQIVRSFCRTLVIRQSMYARLSPVFSCNYHMKAEVAAKMEGKEIEGLHRIFSTFGSKLEEPTAGVCQAHPGQLTAGP